MKVRHAILIAVVIAALVLVVSAKIIGDEYAKAPVPPSVKVRCNDPEERKLWLDTYRVMLEKHSFLGAEAAAVNADKAAEAYHARFHKGHCK